MASVNRWSLSGGTPLRLANGVLSPGHLLVEPDQAILEASFLPGRATTPRRGDVVMPTHDLEDLIIVDDHGMKYLARVLSASGAWRASGEAIGSTHLSILVTPVPKPGLAWLELRGSDGSMSRLIHPPRAALHVGPVTPIAAKSLHNVRGVVVHDSASQSDGPKYDLELGAAFELEGFTVRLDSLLSSQDEWRLHLAAEPGWWLYSGNRQTKWPIVSIHPLDDQGNTYEDRFGGSRPHLDHDDLTLIFRPHLDSRARSVSLLVQGTSEQVILNLELPR